MGSMAAYFCRVARSLKSLIMNKSTDKMGAILHLVELSL